MRMNTVWKKHLWLLTTLAGLLVVFSFILWLHPKLGYAQSGILKGVDLRSDIIQILWICFAMFCVSSSIVLKIFIKLTQRYPVFIWIIAYIFGLVSVKLILPFIDKFY